MEVSKLGSLRLSATEKKSIDGVAVVATQYLEFLQRYVLVGGGKVTDPDFCQKFSDWSGCLEVAIHELAGYHGVFTRKIHYSCGNLNCPCCCRNSWAVKVARKATARLKAVSDRYGQPIEHISLSFDPKFYGIGNEKVYRKMGLKALKALGVFGGLDIFHGSRRRRFERINGDPAGEHSGFRQFGTDWSPHRHILGVIKNGFGCRDCHHKCVESCSQFNQRRWQYAQKYGVYVKVIVRGEHEYAERRNIFASCFYEYNHASIDSTAPRARVGVWFGVAGYRNMGKIKVPKEANLCPICEIVHEKKPIVMLIYTGHKNFILNPFHPDYQRETMQEPYENGLQVWYEKPKRVWDSPVKNDFTGSPVKNGFTVKFEGGGKLGRSAA